jgi:rhodanese-related sulfurtransferase
MAKAVSRHMSKTSWSETCRQAAAAYLNPERPLEITASDLYKEIAEASGYSGDDIKYYDPNRYTSGPIILDVRAADSEMPDAYYAGHLPGAASVPWQQIADATTLACLPKDRRFVVYSANGQTGGQAAAILGILGYDASNLKWGIGSWTRDSDIAPGKYRLARDTIWNEGSAYRTVTSERSMFRAPAAADQRQGEYPFPETGAPFEGSDAVLSAARRYLDHCHTPNISGPDLYRRLYVGRDPYLLCPPGSKEPSAPDVPFLLDVRENKPRSLGYIPGSLHVRRKDVFKVENLKRLPPDRLIVVHSGTGHTGAQVTALLGVLGYRVTNLRFGISAWSLSLPGADIAPGRYSEARDCQNFHVVAGFEPFVRCAS